MPYRESSVGVRAILPFRDPDNAHTGGEIVLRDDNLVQFVPSPSLRKELEGLIAKVDTGALKWGTSLVVALAAAGTGLFWRRQRTAAYGLFVASGLTGAGAYFARRYAHDLEVYLLSPLPLDHLQIMRHDASGGLRVVLNGGGMRKLVATIRPTEFDSAVADVFLRALDSAGASA